jgi:hypothetical protein
MKKIILLFCTMGLIISCTQSYWEIPRDEAGNIILTGVSSTTTTGISTLDNVFSATATFATAKVGDIMMVELLKLQDPPGLPAGQLLPIVGTQKNVTVGSDMKATVTYTRADATMTKATDYVTVVFNGATDFGKVTVTMVSATTVSKPKVSATKEIDIARTSETANFYITVVPKAAAYSGNLVVKKKNGVKNPWVSVTGSPFSGAQPFLVPISGNDFAVGKDTMYYQFTTVSGTYSDVIESKIIVRDPYFYLKKTGVTLTLGGASSGWNLLKNAAVAENNANAVIAIAGSLILKGGSAWLAAGNTIQFVPSTAAMYNANNSTSTIAAFNAASPTNTADPIAGEGIYIFKIVNGPNPENVFYGMIKAVSVVPGVSVTIEYRIGDRYAHLLVIQ